MAKSRHERRAEEAMLKKGRRTQLLKVQYPLSTTDSDSHILIYNRDRSFQANLPTRLAQSIQHLFDVYGPKIFILGRILPIGELEVIDTIEPEHWPSW